VYISINSQRYRQEQKFDRLSSTEELINNELFETRDLICRAMSDLIVECDTASKDEVVDKVIKSILNYYK
jgi:hypothetical protein